MPNEPFLEAFHKEARVLGSVLVEAARMFLVSWFESFATCRVSGHPQKNDVIILCLTEEGANHEFVGKVGPQGLVLNLSEDGLVCGIKR